MIKNNEKKSKINKIVIHSINFKLLLVVLFSTGCQREDVSNIEFPAALKNDSTTIEEACRAVSSHMEKMGIWKQPEAGSGFYNAVDSVSAFIGSSAGDDKAAAFDSVRSFIYNKTGVIFVDRRDSVENLLPGSVYANKKGGCLGVSLMFLIFGEKLDLPLFGVMLPTHFYCRYDDGNRRFNVEPNLKGINHSDEYYKKQYSLENDPAYDQHNMKKREVVGVLCYNVGNVLLNKGRYNAAAAYFAEASKRIGWCLQARGNLGIAFAKSGRVDTASAILKEMYDKYPCMKNVAANYAGVLFMKNEKEKAREVVRKGLECFPEDTVLQKIYENNF